MIYIYVPKRHVQEVTTSRARFPKPVEDYAILAIFGRNIVASEGEEWKRYRKIAAPAFSDVSLITPTNVLFGSPESQRNNRLVWDETIKTMFDMFQNLWGSQNEIVVEHALDVALPVSYLHYRHYHVI